MRLGRPGGEGRPSAPLLTQRLPPSAPLKLAAGLAPTGLEVKGDATSGPAPWSLRVLWPVVRAAHQRHCCGCRAGINQFLSEPLRRPSESRRVHALAAAQPVEGDVDRHEPGSRDRLAEQLQQRDHLPPVEHVLAGGAHPGLGGVGGGLPDHAVHHFDRVQLAGRSSRVTPRRSSRMSWRMIAIKASRNSAAMMPPAAHSISIMPPRP